ncbi:MAG: tRNA dihydrouridine synthase DusB [Pseudomonadales bacterium]|nr:tRNA dihydrouridine synthase DusB [Pseudomonadales bacterium]
MKIGQYEYPSQVIVAPMAGVTDQPFRNLCRELGATWLVSEMVTSDQTLWHTSKSRNRLRFSDEAGPRWVQIAGGDPQMLANAAKVNEGFGAEIIDINMGCPAKKVCKKAAGSALLKDEKLVAQILEAVVSSVDVPVTLKIRLGWSDEQQNAVRIAKIAEDSGVSLLTVHGRTRASRFTGSVNYAAIGEVVEATSIPVIANGDICSAQHARQVLDQTNAAGVMIGRAAQGNPWLINQVDAYLSSGQLPNNPTYGEIKTRLVTHIYNLAEFYGQVMGPRIARKHVGWYLAKVKSAEDADATQQKHDFSQSFNRIDTATEQVDAIVDYFARLVEQQANCPERKQVAA